MKTIPIRLLFAAAAAAAMLCQSASATSYLVEEFQYSTSGRLGDANTGGSGISPALWNTPQNTITFTNGSHSLDGTTLGLVQSFGDKVFSLGLTNGELLDAGPQNGCYNKFVPVAGVIDPAVTTNLYTSFLYQFKNGYDLTNGNVIVQMNDFSGGIQSSSGQRSYWQLMGRWTGSKIQLGIAKCIYQTVASIPAGANVGVTNWDPTLITPGDTFFVVVRVQLNNTNTIGVGGSFRTNVEDDLWINPPPGTFGTNEANVPAPDVNSPVGDGTITSSTSGPGRLFVCDTFAVAELDELRIATTWAEVTPPAGQCLSASIITDPTNVTQSAEIPAIIGTSYIGTGATNQWQLSQDNGATWANIPGAAAQLPTLITANLQYPGDSGNKYRCLVGVSCDNSSATSGVATVTLTPTTTTSPGVIMNDAFTDQTFNYPVTPTHSVWFSLLDASQNPYFSDFPGPGATAKTITNSSTLYVGYFVDQNATPVDLAIGSAIQVTFPFTPNDFSLFTGNGPLRFGLYDYRDLGAPITTSSTTLTGSAGQAYGVMGYMLDLDFGTNFSTFTPLTLYSRKNLPSPGLANTTGDYYSMHAGPVPGVSTNTITFQSGVNNTLIFTVTRIDTNLCSVTATITNAMGLNVSYTAVDTNNLGWHRFDSFALRPNSGVSSCANFFIPSFKVEVIGGITVVPTNIVITSISSATNSVTLDWQASPPDGTYSFSVLMATNLSDPWSLRAPGQARNSYTDGGALTNNPHLFYRVTSP